VMLGVGRSGTLSKGKRDSSERGTIVDLNESEGDRGISLLLAVAMHCDVTTDCRGGKRAVNKHEHAQSVKYALVIRVYLSLVLPFALPYVLL
jgi:hypothetical protein